MHDEHETLIIGAGPAGLQLAYFLEQAGRDYLVLDAADAPGSFFRRQPRHRTLLSVNKQHTGSEDHEFNLRHDWNCLLTDPDQRMPFKDYSEAYFPDADDLVRYLGDFARRFELRIRHGVRVERVERDPQGGFELFDSQARRFRCERLVIATGISKPYVPDIPGIELAEGYEQVSIDPRDFAGQTVLILGKGNSALETAQQLLAHASYIHLSSPEPVRFAWDSHFVGHVRSVNSTFFDSYLLKSQNAILDGPTLGIERLPTGKLRVRWAASHHQDVEEEIEHFEYDRVIRCTGFRFDDSIFTPSCRPQLRSCGRLPELTGAWESVNLPGLYFAGVLMQGIDYQRSQSSFIHGFRYNVRTLFHLMEQRTRGTALPQVTVDPAPQAIASMMLARANGCSSLWQMVGFLCDVYVPSERRWYTDLNIHYVTERWGADPDADYLISMLTYGPSPCDPNYPGSAFDHPHLHPHTSDRALGDLTTEIHPVIRHFQGRELQLEYHVKTDVLSDWSSDFYRRPLVEFLCWHLADGPRPAWLDPEAPRPRRRELVRDSQMRAVDVRHDDQSISTASG